MVCIPKLTKIVSQGIKTLIMWMNQINIFFCFYTDTFLCEKVKEKCQKYCESILSIPVFVFYVEQRLRDLVGQSLYGKICCCRKWQYFVKTFIGQHNFFGKNAIN